MALANAGSVMGLEYCVGRSPCVCLFSNVKFVYIEAPLGFKFSGLVCCSYESK